MFQLELSYKRVRRGNTLACRVNISPVPFDLLQRASSARNNSHKRELTHTYGRGDRVRSIN